MARSRSSLLVLALAVSCLCAATAPAFLSSPRGAFPVVGARAATASALGLAPLALEQPVGAYDSVVAMLQSWLVGGTVLVLIFAAVLVAATANPLTKRRREVTK
eukprot:CAMPEP_0171089872 /NCGR_PEP_ID=MMETSP0766_2-20121228/27386_1 /TAXON_ID=439317 /ORGANISM="Gambierdiscus australes, Strain CAWD 149" /LENGTH=103 /DNA_ID=CAMNT_0011547791 /DNA_START=69 /DNA_END=380 /DNA_ORIENTATION=-